MKNITLAYRSLFKKGRSNGIKILSLGVGLAVGLVLIAKIYFEQTYDDFYPAADRIYRIYGNYSMPGEEGGEPSLMLSGYTSGGVAPGLKTEIPAIEAATRFTVFNFSDKEDVFFTENEERRSGKFIMADSCFFDVLPRPMLIGNAKEVLARPMYALVSETLARSIGHGENVVGKNIRLDSYPNNTIIIGGIFEEMPENSHIQYDAIVSLASISKFFWDGTDNWIGNERYGSFVKLHPSASPESITPAIEKAKGKYLDTESLQKAGYQVSYTLQPLTGLHSSDPAIGRMSVMLALLAFALLFTAVMNYILIVISSMVGRSKQVAIQKCYGASGRNISGSILTETLLHLFLSLGIAVLFVIAFRTTAEELLNVRISSLLSWSSGVILTGVCLIVFIITGLIPSSLFSRIPVATAFRRYSESKRHWKRALLLVQFTACTLLTILLIIIARQYHMLVNDNPGYSFDRLLYCQTEGVAPTARAKAIEELRRLPCVERVSSADALPVFGSGGNNAFYDDKKAFNFSDLSEVDTAYFATMNIPIIDGRRFESGSYKSPSIMVSRAWADKMVTVSGWKNGVTGKTVRMTQHGNVLITGVYDDIRIGGSGLHDDPSILVYSNQPQRFILIRLYEMSQENIRRVSDLLTRTLTGKDIVVIPYKAEIAYLYNDSRLYRNSVLIGGIITLIISVIGLIGYVRDETVRRSKEIALRKVNGATAGQIIGMLTREVCLLALTSALAGGALAYLTARKWLEQFPEKIALSAWIFLAGILFMLLIVTGCVILQSWRIATENPVNAIKAE